MAFPYTADAHLGLCVSPQDATPDTPRDYTCAHRLDSNPGDLASPSEQSRKD